MLPLRIACSTELRIKGRGRRDASLTNRGYDAHLVTLSRGRSSCQGRRLVCPTGKSGVTSSSRKSKIRRPTLSCGLRLRAENCFCFTKKSQIVSTWRCTDCSASDKGHRVAVFPRIDLRRDSASVLFSRTTSHACIHSRLLRNDANARRSLYHVGFLPRQSSPASGNCGHRSDCCRSDGAPRSTTGRTSQLIVANEILPLGRNHLHCRSVGLWRVALFFVLAIHSGRTIARCRGNKCAR